MWGNVGRDPPAKLSARADNCKEELDTGRTDQHTALGQDWLTNTNNTHQPGIFTMGEYQADIKTSLAMYRVKYSARPYLKGMIRNRIRFRVLAWESRTSTDEIFKMVFTFSWVERKREKGEKL